MKHIECHRIDYSGTYIDVRKKEISMRSTVKEMQKDPIEKMNNSNEDKTVTDATKTFEKEKIDEIIDIDMDDVDSVDKTEFP